MSDREIEFIMDAIESAANFRKWEEDYGCDLSSNEFTLKQTMTN